MAVPLSVTVDIQEPVVDAMEASDCYQAAFIEVLLCCCFYFGPVPAICSFASVPTSCVGDDDFISERYICREIKLPSSVVNKEFRNEFVKFPGRAVLEAHVLHVSIGGDECGIFLSWFNIKAPWAEICNLSRSQGFDLSPWNLLRATGPLHVPSTLHIPYKHLSHAPEPVTLRSRLVHILLFTSLNLDYLTLSFSSCIFLFLSRTQHEPLTKLLCQDLAQHNTLYSSFSRSFLSFLSKFLILYVRSRKQLT